MNRYRIGIAALTIVVAGAASACGGAPAPASVDEVPTTTTVRTGLMQQIDKTNQVVDDLEQRNESLYGNG